MIETFANFQGDSRNPGSSKKITSKFSKKSMGVTREDMCKDCQQNPETTIDEKTEILFEQEKDRQENLLKRQKYLNERLMRAKGKQNTLTRMLSQYQEALADEGMGHVLTQSNFHAKINEDGPVYNFGKLYSQQMSKQQKKSFGNEPIIHESEIMEDKLNGSPNQVEGKSKSGKHKGSGKKRYKNPVKKVKRGARKFDSTDKSYKDLKTTGTAKSKQGLDGMGRITGNMSGTGAFKKKKTPKVKRKSTKKQNKLKETGNEVKKRNTKRSRDPEPTVKVSEPRMKDYSKRSYNQTPKRDNPSGKKKTSKNPPMKNRNTASRPRISPVGSNKHMHPVQSEKQLRQNQHMSRIPMKNVEKSNSSKRLKPERSQDKLARARMKHKSRVSSVFADEKMPKPMISRNASKRALSKNCNDLDVKLNVGIRIQIGDIGPICSLLFYKKHLLCFVNTIS